MSFALLFFYRHKPCDPLLLQRRWIDEKWRGCSSLAFCKGYESCGEFVVPCSMVNHPGWPHDRDARVVQRLVALGCLPLQIRRERIWDGQFLELLRRTEAALPF